MNANPDNGGGQDDADSDTIYLPASAGGPDCKAGDKITFTVVGKTADGEIEVKADAPASGSDWKSDLDAHMAQPPDDETQGGM